MAFGRREEKAEFNKKLVVFFIAGIMILSVFGVVFFGFASDIGEQSLSYNGFDFTLVKGLYKLDTEKTSIEFNFFPSEVLDFEVDKGAIEVFKSRDMFYYTSDFHDPFNSTIALMHYNLAPLFATEFSIYMQSAYTTNVSERFHVITCLNATNSTPVIYLRGSDQSTVSLNESCIIIEAETEMDLIGLHERIIYELLGVITS